jgi:hypothetical protein
MKITLTYLLFPNTSHGRLGIFVRVIKRNRPNKIGRQINRFLVMT